MPYVLVGGFSYPVSKFFLFSDNPEMKISIALREINEGITYVEKSKFYIYKDGDYIDIFNAHCTHMGCILNFDKTTKQFNCPCHKSRFDIDGTKLRGPAKRDLDKITFKIKNRTLQVG